MQRKNELLDSTITKKGKDETPDLNIIQMKIMFYIAMKSPELKSDTACIDIEEFIDLLGKTKARHSEIIDSLNKLQNPMTKDQKKIPNFIEVENIDSLDYLVDIRLSEKAKEGVEAIKSRLDRNQIKYAMEFRCKYSMRLYHSYALKLPINEITLKKSEEDIRCTLKCKDKYDSYKSLNQHVLKKATEEIGRLTDMTIEYERDRRSKVITMTLRRKC